MFIGNVAPLWFHGIDTMLDAVSLIIALLVALFGFRIYRFADEKKYFYFSMAFVAIASGLLLKIVGNITYFQGTEQMLLIGASQVFITLEHSFSWFPLFGKFMFQLVMVGAFFILAAVILDVEDWRVAGLFGYFIFVTTVFTLGSYFWFHVTLAVLLAFITFYYFQNDTKLKTRATKFIFSAFSVLLLSQVLFIFVLFGPKLYVAGELTQLAGFLLLAGGFFTALKQ